MNVLKSSVSRLQDRALQNDQKGCWAGFVICSAVDTLTHVTGVLFPLTGGFWALHSQDSRVLPRLALAAARPEVRAAFARLIVDNHQNAQIDTPGDDVRADVPPTAARRALSPRYVIHRRLRVVPMLATIALASAVKHLGFA